MDLTVDSEIPSFVRETGFENWNRFAAVMDEFVPLHMDDAAGQKAGFPGAIGMGNLQWAFFTTSCGTGWATMARSSR